jgi:hypothetical protein
MKNHSTKFGSKHLIGTLGESSLHSVLKDWYAQPGDLLEAQVDGFHIDIIRHDRLIEIQTANFSSQKRKLNTLIEKHPLRLVFPIAQEKWIVRLAADGVTQLGRRKSPKRGNIFQLFRELVSIPDLTRHPNFSLEVLLIQEEEVRCESLIPSDLPDPFSTEGLAQGIDQPRWLAQKMAYCLHNMGVIDNVGKNGNSILYSISSPATRP